MELVGFAAMLNAKNPYAGYRYPAEIISHAVGLYFRFMLSFRDVEELLATRGLQNALGSTT